MTNELKPCPFCGGNPTKFIHEEPPHVEILCEKCCVACSINDEETKAIAAWNTRTPPPVAPQDDAVRKFAALLRNEWETQGLDAMNAMLRDASLKGKDDE